MNQNKQNSRAAEIQDFRSPKRNRRGATAVEFALTAPIVFLIVFSGIEFSRAMVVRNGVQSAAMAGARVGILPGADVADCEAAAENAIAMARIKGASVIVEPSGGINSSTEEVTVTVTAEMNANKLAMSQFVIGKTLSQTITLRRENAGE